MSEKIRPNLANGTLVRHKTKGYEGKIDGITEIKACFTREGAPSPTPLKDSFQYRIVVAEETMRRIAPAEDLEVLQELTEDKAPLNEPKSPLVTSSRKRRKKKAQQCKVVR
jgi:hypothetical protein